MPTPRYGVGRCLLTSDSTRYKKSREKVMKRVFKDGIVVQSHVLDAASNVIGNVGGPLPKDRGSVRDWHL